MRIENSAHARANILIGRVIPALFILCAAWSFVSLLSNGVTRGTLIPIMLTLLWIVAMGGLYLRRGQQRAVLALEFSSAGVEAQFLRGTASFPFTEIQSLEYTGVHNPARVPVLGAPFPQQGERILVLTLRDKTELRVRVRWEHHADLQDIAARL